MHDATDMDLLRQYADGNSDDAFAVLVTRHVDLVFSAALRKTGNPHAAEEITQAVFIILAQKAGRIVDKTILPGWLYQTARLTASGFLRRETRRVRREQKAYMQTASHAVAPDETWEQLAPLLEDAMGQLGDKDRAALVLRFFGGKSFAEVAAAAGVSENAAKKRVIHALEKLHRYFSKRGVSSTTAIIADAISANSVQTAPVALAKAVAASGSTLTLIKGALKIMAWTKAKTAIVAGAAAVLTVGTITIIVKESQHSANKPFVIVKTSRPQPDMALASQSVFAFFEELRAQGRLPGVSKDEHGSVMAGDTRTGADLDLRTMTLPQPVKYPWQMTINFAKGDHMSLSDYYSRPKYHYTFVKTSEDGGWQLQRAWHTDAHDSFIEEFPVP